MDVSTYTLKVQNMGMMGLEIWFQKWCIKLFEAFVVVVVVYFILSRLLFLAFSANLGLLCMPHSGMGPLV